MPKTSYLDRNNKYSLQTAVSCASIILCIHTKIHTVSKTISTVSYTCRTGNLHNEYV